MVSPLLWANVPFKNRTAWIDFAGTHALWHRSVAEHVFADLGVNYRVYPIGDPGGSEWLQAVRAQYVAANAAVGLPAPPDLSSYDLSVAEDHASWTFTLSQTAESLRIAAGVA